MERFFLCVSWWFLLSFWQFWEIPLCWISVVCENILSCVFFTSPHQSQWHTYTYNAWQKSDLVNNSNRFLSSFFLLLNLVAALEWRTASQSMSYDAMRIIGILFLKRWLLTRDALNHKWYSGIAAWTSRASLCKWRFFIRQTQHHRPFSSNISLYGRVFNGILDFSSSKSFELKKKAQFSSEKVTFWLKFPTFSWNVGNLLTFFNRLPEYFIDKSSQSPCAKPSETST